MKRFAILTLTVAILPFMGCNTSPTGGGEGKPFTFKPPGSVTAKQGETKKEKVTISRGTDFKEGVTFSASNLPKGVKVDFEPATVKASDKAETEMVVKVDQDAPLGESTVKVTATPEKGKETSVDVKLKITDGK